MCLLQELLGLATPAVYRTAPCMTQNATGGCYRTTELNTWTTNSGLSTDASCSWVGSRLDYVLTTNELYQSLFGTGPRPPVWQGLGPVVLVHLGRFSQTKQGRCENTLRVLMLEAMFTMSKVKLSWVDNPSFYAFKISHVKWLLSLGSILH